MKSILDPSFHYTRSIDTDLRKTFARVRRELRQQAQSHGEQSAKVVSMSRRTRAAAS